MKGQKGFTLIELMIVVAVIGVLSAIAIPQYQKYVAKAEAASALATLTGVKTNAEAYTIDTGSFPAQAVSAAIGFPVSDMINFTLVNKTSGAGAIIATFVGSTPSISGNKIWLERNANGSWKCGTDFETNSGFAPKNCSTSGAVPTS
ncbi:pilin [Photobacterium damselae]|uniref:pilin n=1 Tax=Photobacterium damselae TaxID=38293 RepID=UPI002F3F90D2